MLGHIEGQFEKSVWMIWDDRQNIADGHPGLTYNRAVMGISWVFLIVNQVDQTDV